MDRCINISHPEFKELVRQSNINPLILKSKVGIWQEKNNTDKFPTLEQLGVRANINVGRINSKQDIEGFKKFIGKANKLSSSITKNVQKLFESNPELANAVYEALGFKSEDYTGIGTEDLDNLIDDNLNINWDLLDKLQEELFSKEAKWTLKNRPEKHTGEKFTWEHIQNVVESAKKIPIPNNVDRKTLILAALLHDIGKPYRNEDHALDSVKVINRLFKDNKYSKLVKLAVRHHMISTSTTQEEYKKIVQDAQRNGIKSEDFIELLLALNIADITRNREENVIDDYSGKSIKNTLLEEIPFKRKQLETIYQQQKQETQKLYSQYLDSLNKPNTNPILQTNQQEQVKKFTELQERLNSKEFLEGAKNAYESSKGLQEWGTQEQYNDYIARVSLGIIKNPSSRDYNYTSKVKDIVYHGTDAVFEKFKPTKPKFDTLNSVEGVYNFTTNKEFSKRYGKNILFTILNINNPIQEKTSGEFIDDMDRPLSEGLYKIGKKKGDNILAPKYDEALKNTDAIINRIEGDNYALPVQTVISVFEPEQIHILGTKQDIEGFKKFVSAETPKKVTNPRKGGLAQEVVMALAEKIQQAIPGISIEYTHDLAESKVAQRRGGTLYFNLDRITPDTPMHEFGHIWLDILEETDPKQFEVIEREIRNLLANNSDLSRAMREKYPDLDGRKYYKEVAAYALGYRTESQVTAFVMNNKIQGDNLVQKILSFIQKISDILVAPMKEFFGTTEDIDLGQTLNDIFDNVAAGVIAGNSVFRNDPLLHKDLMDYVSENDVDDQRVGNMKDLFKELSTNVGNRFEKDFFSDVKLASTFLRNNSISKNIKDPEKGKYVYSNKFMKIYLDSKTKDEVLRKVIPAYRKIEKDFKKNISLALNDYLQTKTAKSTFSTYAKNRFKDSGIDKNYFENGVFEEVLRTLHLDGKTTQAMLYSELKDSADPEFKELFHKDLIGDDYVILVHSDTAGQKEISIIDITMQPFYSGVNVTKASNIFRKFSGNKDLAVSRDGVRLTNKDSHVMLFGALMTAKNSMIRNKNLKIRDVGVIGLSAKDIKTEFSINIANDFRNISAMTGYKDLMDIIDSEELKRTITTPVTKSGVSSAMDKLIRFYQGGGYTYGTGNKIFSGDIDKLQSGSISDRRAVILKRLGTLSEWIQEQDQLEKENEYRLLSAAMIDMVSNGQSDRNDVSDMSRVGAFFQTPFSIGSDLVQIAYNELVKANGMIVNETMKWHNISRKLVDPIIKKRDALRNKSRIGDYGSEFFKHLYQTEKGIDENGNPIDIVIPGMLHVAKNIGTEESPKWEFYNDQTEQLYKEGLLDNDDLKYTWAVANMVRTKYAESILQQKKFSVIGTDSRPFQMEDAYAMLDESSFQFGMVPIMDKTMGEMLFKGMFKSTAVRWWEQATNVNAVFQEMLSDENTTNSNKLYDVFSGQMKFEDRLAKAGLQINDDGLYEIINRDLYDKIGLNTERAAVAFNLNSNRVQTYSDRVLPVYNSANTIMKMYEEMGKDQRNTKIALKNLVDRVLYHKINETGEGGTVNIAKVVDAGSMLMTYAHIFARPILFVKSTVWNSIQLLVTALSNSIASNGHFNIPELMGAFKESFGLRKFAKMMKMLRYFNIVDRSEFDMMQHPWLVKSDRSLFQSFYGYIFNYFSDVHARGVTMIAEMKRDGSWDAYDINDKGEVVYDETKDKRMYKNGKLTEEGKILRESIRKDLIEQGFMAEEDEKLSRGHDIIDADNFKYVSDKYIVGAYDNISKSLATQHIVGRLAAKFRIFAASRLENLGFFMSERKTVKGQARQVLKDPETGELITDREVIEMEGMLQSLGRTLGYIRHIKNQPNPALFWKSLPPVAKNNLVKILVESAAFCALFGAIIGFGGGDSEEEKKIRREKKLTYSWIYSDVLSVSLAADIYSNPFPFIDSVDRFIGSFFGLMTEGEVDRNLFTLVPGYGLYKDADSVVSSLSNNE